MEIPNRQKLETQLARRLERLNAKQRRKVYLILGNPPDLEKMDLIDWDEFEREVESETMLALYLIFMASAGFHIGLTAYASDSDRTSVLNRRATSWARERAATLSQLYTKSARESLTRASEKMRAPTRETVPPAEKPVTPSQGFEVDQKELDRELQKALGPAKSSRAAANETSAAQYAGGEAGIELTVGTSIYDRWDERPEIKRNGPCPNCHALHMVPRYQWGTASLPGEGHGGNPADGPPLGPFCYCVVQYANLPDLGEDEKETA